MQLNRSNKGDVCAKYATIKTYLFWKQPHG